VGRRQGGAHNLIWSPRRQSSRAWAEAGPRQGKCPSAALWPAMADARSKIGTAPDAQSGMR
jgi:hypothetical protein